jgi:hypothetical protein
MQNFLNQITALFSFKYLIYWVEILVILAIVLLVVYISFALNLFKRSS